MQYLKCISSQWLERLSAFIAICASTVQICLVFPVSIVIWVEDDVKSKGVHRWAKFSPNDVHRPLLPILGSRSARL